jgi:ABC-type polysaccharide/polyol phosphate export permease
LFIFCWSLSILAGFANVYFQDTQHLCEVGFQIFFYVTPIMYSKDLLIQNHLEWMLRINPLVPMLDLMREPIVEGRFPTPAAYATACVTVVLMAAAAIIALARLQRRVIFYL